MLRTFDDIYETMPWDAVDAVVFDVGQVLLSYNPQEILDEHVPDRPDLHPILLEKIFRSPYWLMRDHGLMTRDEAIEAMIGRDELLRPYITRVMHNWVDLKKVLPEGLKTLQSCKAHGKKVYVLSNYADDAFRFLYKGIIIKHNKTEPTYTKTSLFLCEKRRFFMGRTEKGGKVF